MTKEEKEALVKEIQAGIEAAMAEKLKEISDAQAEIKAALDAKVGAEAIDEVKASVEKVCGEFEAFKAEAEKEPEVEPEKEPEADPEVEPVKASAEEIPAPKAGQGIVPNPNVGESDKEAKMKEIQASAMNPMDKLREITKLRMQG